MNYYLMEYLIGGYGSYGKVVLHSGYAKSHKDFLDEFWKRYEGMVDCVKPKILHLFLCDKGIKKEIQMAFPQKSGRN